MLILKNYNLLISIIIVFCLFFIYFVYFLYNKKDFNNQSIYESNEYDIEIYPSRFFTWDIVKNDDFILLSYFNYTWLFIKSWNILAFQSDNLTCDLVKKTIEFIEIVEFNNIEDITRNKFVWTKVCFVNFYDSDIVTRWFYVDTWHWIQIPKEKYYEIKFYIYNK